MFRSCTINISLAGIFARKLLAIGYPEQGKPKCVSTVGSSGGEAVKDEGLTLLHATRRREAHPSVQDLRTPMSLDLKV